MWKNLKGRLRTFLKALLQDDEPRIRQIPRFIDDSRLLTKTNQGWYIGKRRIKPEEVVALKAEAKDFSQSFLWQMMRRDIHFLAYLQSTNKRHTEADAFYGSAMYRDLEILEEFIKNCAEL